MVIDNDLIGIFKNKLKEDTVRMYISIVLNQIYDPIRSNPIRFLVFVWDIDLIGI